MNQPNRDEILKMFQKQKKQETKDPQITNIHELRQLVERLKPEADVEPNEPIVVNARDVGFEEDRKIVIPASGNQSTLRKTLLEGLEMVKNHGEYFKASYASLEDDDDYAGYPPAIGPSPDSYGTWVDRFIKNNLGGKRVGLFIEWELPSGRWRLEPWSCKLEKIDAS